jgi:seryl-tRNA synthetase
MTEENTMHDIAIKLARYSVEMDTIKGKVQNLERKVDIVDVNMDALSSNVKEFMGHFKNVPDMLVNVTRRLEEGNHMFSDLQTQIAVMREKHKGTNTFTQNSVGKEACNLRHAQNDTEHRNIRTAIRIMGYGFVFTMFIYVVLKLLGLA